MSKDGKPKRRDTPRHVVITHPKAIPPDAETHVVCPVCRQGMVPASLGRAVSESLKRDSVMPGGGDDDAGNDSGGHLPG